MNKTSKAERPLVHRAICGSCLAKNGEPHRDWCQTHTQRYLMSRLLKLGMDKSTQTVTGEGNAPRKHWKAQCARLDAECNKLTAERDLLKLKLGASEIVSDKLQAQRDELQTSLDIALKHIGIVLKDRDALLATARMFVESYKGKIHMLGNGKAMQAYVQFEDIISEIAAIAKAEGRAQ